MKQIQVDKNSHNQRIDKLIRKYLKKAPLSFIYKLFRKKDIKVNGKKVDINYIVKENDIIQIYVSDDTLNEFEKENIVYNSNNNLDIIYEDDNILIINKDSGILIHEGENNNKVNTLNNDILSYLKSKNEYHENSLYTPSCIHRLDRNTSGLVIACKSLKMSQLFLELFKDKEKISKQYITIVNGVTKEKDVINKPLLKDEHEKYVKVSSNGLEAITTYEKLTDNGKYSLLKVNILTGRTHQIRVHFKSIDHPVIGDDKYGDFKANKSFYDKYKYKSQFLHSYKLEFKELKGELKYLSNKIFIAPLKPKQKEIIKDLFNEYVI